MGATLPGSLPAHRVELMVQFSTTSSYN